MPVREDILEGGDRDEGDRRGLFGLIGGVVADLMCLRSSASLATWRSIAPSVSSSCRSIWRSSSPSSHPSWI